MFESELADKFKTIFGIKKVTYDQPSEAKEQDCIFVEITESKNVIKNGRAHARVSGNAVLFAQGDKVPFGFLSKRIMQAESDLTRNLFFFDIESNTKIYGNIVNRGFSFVYFFSEDYDPEVGTITSVEFEEL